MKEKREPSNPLQAVRDGLDQIEKIEKLPKWLQPVATAWLYLTSAIEDILRPLK